MTTDWFLWPARVALVVLGLPVLVYFVVKFGTLGYLAAKKQFRSKRKDKDNGHATTEE